MNSKLFAHAVFEVFPYTEEKYGIEISFESVKQAFFFYFSREKNSNSY